jgi:hypothetical protein
VKGVSLLFSYPPTTSNEKKVFYTDCTIVFFSKNKCQFYNIDSLKQQLNYATEDTNKLFLLLRIAHTYTWSYADTSIMYTQQALDLAQKLNDEGELQWHRDR